MSKRQSKSTRKPAKRAAECRRSKAPRTPPVEKAWLKFVVKFQAFKKMPDGGHDKKIHKAWEKALFATDKAAYAVMAAPATCLRDMEIKIQAWAFTAEVKIGDDLAGLANWQLDDCDEVNVDSEFIASLRDDIRLIKRLVLGANIVVGSITKAPPPMPDMPSATPYPVNSSAVQS
jgi:hypothetical protein